MSTRESIQNVEKPEALLTSSAPAGGTGELKRRVIKRIVAAVDHEHHAALEMALSLAAPLHAQVAVIHVLEPMAVVGAEDAYVYTQTLEQQRNFAKSFLKEIKREIPENALAFTSLREGAVGFFGFIDHLFLDGEFRR